MENFDVLTLLCGLALFLYGMDVMGDALKKSAGHRLKTVLGHLTANTYKGFLLGLGVTAVIQSSSATTVMVVGFVNSGAMLLSQAVSVIMGANVGTAVTAWITALNGIEGGADAVIEYLDAWTKTQEAEVRIDSLAKKIKALQDANFVSEGDVSNARARMKAIMKLNGNEDNIIKTI